ncbi:sulfate ABC transporter ATP-binding protein [candidate division KSB1 bacterium]|nr:sulfate ABC transporter ATP-binding protein [candidate division KSB1 bacterium]
MSIEIQHVSKSFGRFKALKDISLQIKNGELVAFLGPSGSGKTTLLRIIAGLDIPDSGKVILYGEDVSTRNPKDRHVGFVFQHYALFEHLTVFENVAFGLRVQPRKQRLSKNDIRDRAFSLLQLVQLEHFSNRYPAQLSGGQRQRVALARALAIKPKFLLLDEPFGALDAKVRKDLRRWLRRLHENVNVTSVFVTHDQEEAMEVADRLVIINEGQIEQIGTPEAVYHNPANAFVFKFIGDVNFFHCRIENGIHHFHNSPINSPASDTTVMNSCTQTVFTRPHFMEISLEPPAKNFFKGKVVHVNPAGPLVKVELQSEWDETLFANISQQQFLELKLKSDMHVFITPHELRSFESDIARE